MDKRHETRTRVTETRETTTTGTTCSDVNQNHTLVNDPLGRERTKKFGPSPLFPYIKTVTLKRTILFYPEKRIIFIRSPV